MSKQTPIQALLERYWESIPPAWHRTRAAIRTVAAEEFNLTVEQFQVLRRIRRGMASVSAIAEDSRTSRSAVSRAVEALVRRGLVSRSQNPTDRRNLPLTLTGEGERVLTGVFAGAEAWLEVRFARLSREERQSLLAGMEILQKTFSSD